MLVLKMRRRSEARPHPILRLEIMLTKYTFSNQIRLIIEQHERPYSNHSSRSSSLSNSSSNYTCQTFISSSEYSLWNRSTRNVASVVLTISFFHSETISEGLRVKFWASEETLYEQIQTEFELLCKQNKIKGSLTVCN